MVWWGARWPHLRVGAPCRSAGWAQVANVGYCAITTATPTGLGASPRISAPPAPSLSPGPPDRSPGGGVGRGQRGGAEPRAPAGGDRVGGGGPHAGLTSILVTAASVLSQDHTKVGILVGWCAPPEPNGPSTSGVARARGRMASQVPALPACLCASVLSAGSCSDVPHGPGRRAGPGSVPAAPTPPSSTSTGPPARSGTGPGATAAGSTRARRHGSPAGRPGPCPSPPTRRLRAKDPGRARRDGATRRCPRCRRARRSAGR